MKKYSLEEVISLRVNLIKDILKYTKTDEDYRKICVIQLNELLNLVDSFENQTRYYHYFKDFVGDE
jgi:hypothetical protein